MSKTLECSSKGDRRYSAFYAKIKLFGKLDSIENHYQLSKRIGDFVPQTWKDVKGKKPTHLSINGKDYDLKYTVSFYEIMWVNYLDNNPELIDHITRNNYDDFHDMFRSKNSVVCQADIIRDYVQKGREYILEKHKEFIDLLIENENWDFRNYRYVK